ncbi:antitoxin VbhA family protein [Mycobacterium pseudokansasii]|uniref:antitoxin VbhA family protein n=1 Tax=Mycobacterium pseudokansasii TaxID=2341080 RepID=UPI001459FEFF|nr:antitoxin VbhA family protein [Mycobacterium pseudokansasii]
MSNVSRVSGAAGRWPELFVGLSAEKRRIVNNAIASNVLEGWEPSRADVEAVIEVATGRACAEDFVANLPHGEEVRGLG